MQNDDLDFHDPRTNSVVSAMDRLAEGSRMLDEQGSHLLALLIHAVVKERAADEEKKRETEEQAKKVNEEGKVADATGVEGTSSAPSTSTAIGEHRAEVVIQITHGRCFCGLTALLSGDVD